MKDSEAINRGFTNQSATYDEADRANVILQDLREQVHTYLQSILQPQSRILELNAGTGIDAQRLTAKGHFVHATDLADGMVREIRRKAASPDLEGHLTCEQTSYEHLDRIHQRDFDIVFSNFGGLNCIKDLDNVTKHLPLLMKTGGHVVWVIMPKICPWELLWILRGDWSRAGRRLRKAGVRAHVEGEYFQTYYHSLSDIRTALGPSFKLVRSESLALISPPPHATRLAHHHPVLYKWMRRIDRVFRSLPPFNRWGDHIIVSFRYMTVNSTPASC